jgi:hypothetical protein
MAEGDVRLFGADTGVSRRQFPWLAGGAAIVVLLALRSRPQASGGPTLSQGINEAAINSQDTSLEFFRIQQQAATELAQLMASNKLEMQAQEYNFELQKAQLPGAQRMCIPYAQWNFLDQGTKNSLRNRVANGQLLESVGPDGICFTPTAAGAAGYMPYSRTKTKSGLFGGSFETVGPANAGSSYNPGAPPPTIFGFIESLLRAFNQPIF